MTLHAPRTLHIASPRHTLTNPHLLPFCTLFISSLPPPPPSADVLEWLATLTLWQMYQCYEFLQEPGFTDYLISFLSLRSLPTLRLLVLFAALWISYSNVFHVRRSILTVLVTIPLTLHFVTLLCLLFSHQHTAHWFLFPSQSDFSELKLAKQSRNPSIKGHLSILVFFFFLLWESIFMLSCYYFYLTRGFSCFLIFHFFFNIVFYTWKI